MDGIDIESIRGLLVAAIIIVGGLTFVSMIEDSIRSRQDDDDKPY